VTFAIGVECVDVKDRSCVEVCPVDCIYEGARRLYIHPFECIDCGACIDVCPVDAISAEGYADAEASPLVQLNSAFFTELLPGRSSPLGSPGAAADVGMIAADTAAVRALAPAGRR
jgi:NAD-dependent dihydropyrimidine dehydrogenase PreA subunit